MVDYTQIAVALIGAIATVIAAAFATGILTWPPDGGTDGGEHSLKLVPFYEYWNTAIGDHFYQTTTEDLSSIGWNYAKIACYVFPTWVDEEIKAKYGLVPLYEYWNTAIGDHFYQTTKEDLSGIGWKYEKIACYVSPQSEIVEHI